MAYGLSLKALRIPTGSDLGQWKAFTYLKEVQAHGRSRRPGRRIALVRNASVLGSRDANLIELLGLSL